MRVKRSDFPADFIFGVATASYQIEGAVNEDGRGPSIWDDFSHTPGKIITGETGDVACDHYHRYKEDVRIMKEIGVEGYRFSIAWPRIMPDGKTYNPKGMDFYQRLVDELLANDIKPMVTLYHWDLPSALNGSKGWLSDDTPLYFRDYAATVFEKLGDRVKLWITLNEPWCSAFLGYFMGIHAPGHTDIQEAITAAHNLLRAHGLAVKEFRSVVKDGLIGLTNVVSKVEPATDKPEDIQAAAIVDQLVNGWFHDTVIKGVYPEEARRTLESIGIKVRDDDMDVISTPFDFFGVNYYTRQLIAFDPESPMKYKHVEGPLPKTEMGWEIYPQGLYDMLKRLWNSYRLPLYVTENGMAGPDVLENGEVHDPYRIEYLETHFEKALKAIKDGVDLRGYFVWTLMDNFEWAFGYSKRFGLVYVDYTTQKRYLKDSAKWFSEFMKS
ncbi:MAG: beta-glucosidase [Thermotogota bacterium]|nr:beta-glucosidase [Thermotogota bacterium]MDK2864165.1 beta-glucosidase [Thermotogota bacterium]HCZ05662.1 beta-glucosidase [Thermotogota bacterium]